MTEQVRSTSDPKQRPATEPRWLIGLLLCLATFGCEGQQSDRREASGTSANLSGDAASTGQEHLELSTQQLLESQRKALSGDALAANNVAWHFSELSIRDPKAHQLANEWFRVAAENGDAVSMIEVARKLAEDRDEKGCLRAAYWLDLAATQASDDDELAASVERSDRALIGQGSACSLLLESRPDK